jgi:hypothetical protein
MHAQNQSPQQSLSPWATNVTLLFLGFFPGAFLMHAQQEEKPTPVLLEYDLMILKIPSAANVPQIPNFEDWQNPAIRRPLQEQGWRILNEPKLTSPYPADFGFYLGPILGLDGTPTTDSKKRTEYNIRFETHVLGAGLQTKVDFFAELDTDAPALTHTLLHFPGKTTVLPLSVRHQKNGFRYFLLLKVTPQTCYQIGGPTVAPAGATTAP